MDVADYTTYENILVTPHRLNDRPIEVNRMIQDKDELEEHTQSLHDRKIFVSGLPKKLTDVELTEFFATYGQIELAYILKHRNDNRSKGFGFICFADRKGKDIVLEIASKYGISIGDKKIVCTSYTPKNSKSITDNNQSSLNGAENSESLSQRGTIFSQKRSKQSLLNQLNKRQKQYSLSEIEGLESNFKINIRKPRFGSTTHQNWIVTPTAAEMHMRPKPNPIQFGYFSAYEGSTGLAFHGSSTSSILIPPRIQELDKQHAPMKPSGQILRQSPYWQL